MRECIQEGECGTHGSEGVILIGVRIGKVYHDAVPDIAGDIAFPLADNGRTGFLW